MGWGFYNAGNNVHANVIPLDQSTIYWPTSRLFQLDEVYKGKMESGFWYEANNFSGVEHGGTHIDAPAHFAKGRWRVDEIPLNRLIALPMKIGGGSGGPLRIVAELE